MTVETIDTKELRRLAQAATHPTTKGRWMRLFGERTVYDRMEDGCRGIPIVAADHHHPGPQVAAHLDFIAAANPAAISELLDRIQLLEQEKLEATEKTNREWLRANAPGGWIDNLRIENEALRAKVAEMEKQEPVAKVESWTNGSYTRHYKLKWLRDVGEGATLYALPGAQTQGDSNVATD